MENSRVHGVRSSHKTRILIFSTWAYLCLSSMLISPVFTSSTFAEFHYPIGSFSVKNNHDLLKRFINLLDNAHNSSNPLNELAHRKPIEALSAAESMGKSIYSFFSPEEFRQIFQRPCNNPHCPMFAEGGYHVNEASANQLYRSLRYPFLYESDTPLREETLDQLRQDLSSESVLSLLEWAHRLWELLPEGESTVLFPGDKARWTYEAFQLHLEYLQGLDPLHQKIIHPIHFHYSGIPDNFEIVTQQKTSRRMKPWFQNMTTPPRIDFFNAYLKKVGFRPKASEPIYIVNSINDRRALNSLLKILVQYLQDTHPQEKSLKSVANISFIHFGENEFWKDYLIKSDGKRIREASLSKKSWISYTHLPIGEDWLDFLRKPETLQASSFLYPPHRWNPDYQTPLQQKERGIRIRELLQEKMPKDTFESRTQPPLSLLKSHPLSDIQNYLELKMRPEVSSDASPKASPDTSANELFVVIDLDSLLIHMTTRPQGGAVELIHYLMRNKIRFLISDVTPGQTLLRLKAAGITKAIIDLWKEGPFQDSEFPTFGSTSTQRILGENYFHVIWGELFASTRSMRGDPESNFKEIALAPLSVMPHSERKNVKELIFVSPYFERIQRIQQRMESAEYTTLFWPALREAVVFESIPTSVPTPVATSTPATAPVLAPSNGPLTRLLRFLFFKGGSTPSVLFQ